MRNFENIKTIMQEHGLQVPDDKIYFKVADAKQKMQTLFEMFVPGYEWISEYDEVAEWMTDNKGRGLFLYGNCGRGKTMLAKYVIPALLLSECRKVMTYYDISDLKDRFEELKQKKIFGVDDIGTEEIVVKFGNRTDVFAEIMDLTEKKSKLIVVTSNYQKDELLNRYGRRILDRIIATTTRVCFTGKSFRGEL
ncbi:MAG: hypothetical protein WCH34_17235 [Bacteroidota bacterium]